MVETETPHVPDSHTLLSNIPSDTQWYTVIDLCSAFFSVPLHPDSQYLFAFTSEGQQYDLANLNVPSTVLQHAYDLLVCSFSKEQCQRDSIAVLTALAKGGHKGP